MLGDLGDFFDSIPDGLDAEGRRNLIRSTLPGVLDNDYGLTQSFNLYKNAGLGIRYDDFRTIYYDVLGEEVDATRIQNVRYDATPSDSILRPSDYNISGRYRFVSQVHGINTITGKSEIRTFSYDTDDKLTMGELNDEALELARDSDSWRNFDPSSARIIRGYIRRDTL